MQEDHLIEYTILGRDKLVKYKIKDWRRHNTVLDYNCPCQKETGFFFLPLSTASELISVGKCSEMDILLDLWMSTIYNDERVQGSFSGPVVYFRNGTGNPLVSYSDLALRWGISKATVGRVLKKLERQGLSLIHIYSSQKRWAPRMRPVSASMTAFKSPVGFWSTLALGMAAAASLAIFTL